MNYKLCYISDREVYTGHILQQTDGKVLHPRLYSLEQPASNTVRGTINLSLYYMSEIYNRSSPAVQLAQYTRGSAFKSRLRLIFPQMKLRFIAFMSLFLKN